MNLHYFPLLAALLTFDGCGNEASNSMANTIIKPSTEKKMHKKDFLGIDFNQLDFNPITSEFPIWNDRLEKRFERLGVDKVTSTLHIKGVGALDPLMVKCGNAYAEKITFFEYLENKSVDVDGILSIKKGNYDDLFKWTLLYLTKYDYKTEANKALYGKFILYGFNTQEECDILFEKLVKKNYQAEKINTPRYLGIKYIVVTIINEPTKKVDINTANERLEKIEKLDL